MLTTKDKNDIKKLFREGSSYEHLMDKYNISKESIKKAINPNAKVGSITSALLGRSAIPSPMLKPLAQTILPVMPDIVETPSREVPGENLPKLRPKKEPKRVRVKSEKPKDPFWVEAGKLARQTAEINRRRKELGLDPISQQGRKYEQKPIEELVHAPMVQDNVKEAKKREAKNLTRILGGKKGGEVTSITQESIVINMGSPNLVQEIEAIIERLTLMKQSLVPRKKAKSSGRF